MGLPQVFVLGRRRRSGGWTLREGHDSGAHVVDDANPPGVASARLRFDHDLDILAKPGQQAHQALAREVRQMAVEQGRHFRLIDAHERCGSSLCEAALTDDLTNPAGELCLRELFFRMGKTEIRKHVPRTGGHRDDRFLSQELPNANAYGALFESSPSIWL